MWTMLAGVPGKLKTLLDRLTSTRAANLDNLNATISSRAQASTAVSNAVLTDERIERLDANVLQYGVVKSVQRGTITMASSGSGSATITAVVLAKSIVISSFQVSASSQASANVRCTLASTTSVIADRSGSDGTCVVDYQVIEFY